MSLRDVIARAAVAAFKATGDIPVSAVLNRVSTVYDAVSGVSALAATTFSTTAIFTSFDLSEVGRGEVLKGDKKAIIPQTELATTPTIIDTLTDNTGKVHQIIGIKQDPAAAIWTLHARAIS